MAKKNKNNSKKKGSQKKENGIPATTLPRWAREGIGIALIGCSVFLFLSLFSYSPTTDPGFFHEVSPKPQNVKNLGGPVGSYTASFLKETLGLGSYFVGALVAVAALFVIWGRKPKIGPWKILPGLCALIFTSVLFSLLLPDRASPEQGGIIGLQIARWLLGSLHPVGSYLLVLLLLVLSIIAIGEMPLLIHLKRIWILLWRGGVTGTKSLIRGLRSLAQWIRRLLTGLAAFLMARGRNLWERLKQLRLRKQEEAESEIVEEVATKVVSSRPARPPDPQPDLLDTKDLKTDEKEAPRIVPPPNGEDPSAADAAEEKARKKKKPKQAALPFPEPLPEAFRPPPLELLDDPDPTQIPVDSETLLANAKVLEQKLKDFGINGKVTEIHPGPIITLFEYAPAPGIKVNKIVNLSDDLALAMKAVSVRIVAPIPGKAVVGMEVPNPSRQVVYLKETLSSDAFQGSQSKLPLALGKDIAGKPVATDLSRMPHLLIAGATGTGKSVCLHTLILSLLYRFSPQEVKFLIIDPKLLELSAYHGIPHLMHPVITDARRAQDVLDWAVERMEQRYQLLSEKGVRNIETYNQRIEQEMKAAGGSPEDLEDHETEGSGNEEEIDEGSLPEKGKLPYIILVIDEMADLMIVSGRQIEESITRLAQMARAAGIHLLLATQRPSVDVLTGIIKANLPTRISFQVSSRIDSRTILDSIGAEKLLGMGDMLFLPPGTSKIRRIHGAYVTEPEIERVVEYLKQFGKPRYEKIPFRSKKSGKNKEEETEFEEDPKYDEAVRLVTSTRQASISMIQRKLRVGYNRAARMIERMEQEGVVGPQEGVKPREVLANSLEE